MMPVKFCQRRTETVYIQSWFWGGNLAGDPFRTGGYLAQDRIRKDQPGFEVVTKRQPTEQGGDRCFGWRVVRHVKSNAIVYAGDECTLGVGAGQMSWVDSSRIALESGGGQPFPKRIDHSFRCLFLC